MKDPLGDRMKSQYEDRTRTFLPRRTYTIIRVDGKAFHKLTKNFKRPYDPLLMKMMDETAIALCKEIQGACFAYTQSDEISVLLTDFAKITTNAWFDGNIQKMVSIAASVAAVTFSRQMAANGILRSAYFDARVFTIPDAVEVENYFIWRQQDATRNSVQMAARAVYSHRELENKNVSDLHELLHQKGINWNNYTSGEKRGRCIVKQQVNKVNEYRGSQTGQAAPPETIIRNEWVSMSGEVGMPVGHETPIFTQDRTFLRKLIPVMEQFEPADKGEGASS